MEMKYWEDLMEGEQLQCRTISFTQNEIIAFARQYDPLFFHVDPVQAEKSVFGGIIASSLQTLSATTRVLVDAQGPMAIVTGMGMEAVKLENPVRPDDVVTITAHWEELRRSRSRPGIGLGVLRFQGRNQRGKPVLESGFKYMIACREAG